MKLFGFTDICYLTLEKYYLPRYHPEVLGSTATCIKNSISEK